MIRHPATTVAIFLMVLVAKSALCRSAVDARVKETGPVLTAAPAYCIVEHNVGRIALAVTNHGVFGDGFFLLAGTTDCFTGQPVHACEYPVGSDTRYLFAGAFWIGAVVGNDTLVSLGADGWHFCEEFHPDESPVGDMIYRSILDPDHPEFIGAVSEQDYIAVYTDTFTSGVAGLCQDQMDGRLHLPLYIEITQRSYAWSYMYAQDFVLFDYTIKNIGTEALDDVYMGILVDADVHSQGNVYGFTDDITGYRETSPAWYMPGQCGSYDDEVNLAWIADNDGDLSGYTVPHITATSLLRFPSYSPQISYNWWVSNGDSSLDFGPQHVTSRDFQTGGVGTPVGDRNKYYIMRNGEHDYDQIFTASIDALDTLWKLPNQTMALDLSDGIDTRYLLSFGPFDIYPGEERPLAFAYVGGENFHTDPSNGSNLPGKPWQFYDNVNFTDLAMNTTWAKWVYDNPGVDSDSDGYAGEFRVCEGDTFWHEGDGVPDFRAAGSPPAPVFWIEPLADGFWIRWNGLGCETTPDVFSRRQDFEGYKVYLSTGGGPSSFAVQASYDVEDYFKYYWTPAGWTLGGRFTTEELRCLYAPSGCGDLSWDPDDYSSPTYFPYDSMFYFEPVGLNLSKLGIETPIVKRYPMVPEPPTLDRDSIPPGQEGMYLTDDGYFKYYEYELTISNLLSSNPYWISVTAMDYGSFMAGVPPLESSVMDNARQVSTLGCCVGPTGNVDGDPSDIADIGDVHRMINHLFITLEPLDCPEEADLDYSGEVDMGDLTLFIFALYVYVVSPPPCP